jgi:hypothetical protein
LRQLGGIGIHLACCKKSTLQRYEHNRQPTATKERNDSLPRLRLARGECLPRSLAAFERNITRRQGTAETRYLLTCCFFGRLRLLRIERNRM